jgi:hypothetical protein
MKEEFDILFAEHQKLLGELQAMRALAKPEQEPVAWPCVIAEADFSENTVTLAMQCTDYKVSAGKHWLFTTPPQRTWVGLTDEEIRHIYICTTGWSISDSDPMLVDFAENIEAKLKEKNNEKGG